MSRTVIHKVDLNVSDLDRHYYQSHALTIALHPSETEERLMVRLLAFALNADEQLVFGKGLSTDNEPDVGIPDYADQYHLWIDVGLPDPKWLKKASRVAKRVVLYTYGASAAEVWWKQQQAELSQLENLTVIRLPTELTKSLAGLCKRNMQVACTIQAPTIWVSEGERSLEFSYEVWQQAAV